jgi:hypothetical protein
MNKVKKLTTLELKILAINVCEKLDANTRIQKQDEDYLNA